MIRLLILLHLVATNVVVSGASGHERSAREAMDALVEAVVQDKHDLVLDAASGQWRKLFGEHRFSSLADLSSGIMEAGGIAIEYSEGVRGANAEYVLFFCSVTTSGERPAKYMASIVWRREPAGWRFLNLPFKDYTLPPELTILTPGSASRFGRGGER